MSSSTAFDFSRVMSNRSELLAPVVQTLDSANRRINQCPADKYCYLGNQLLYGHWIKIYPSDSATTLWTTGWSMFATWKSLLKCACSMGDEILQQKKFNVNNVHFKYRNRLQNSPYFCVFMQVRASSQTRLKTERNLVYTGADTFFEWTKTCTDPPFVYTILAGPCKFLTWSEFGTRVNSTAICNRIRFCIHRLHRWKFVRGKLVHTRVNRV